MRTWNFYQSWYFKDYGNRGPDNRGPPTRCYSFSFSPWNSQFHKQNWLFFAKGPYRSTTEYKPSHFNTKRSKKIRFSASPDIDSSQKMSICYHSGVCDFLIWTLLYITLSRQKTLSIGTLYVFLILVQKSYSN